MRNRMTVEAALKRIEAIRTLTLQLRSLCGGLSHVDCARRLRAREKAALVDDRARELADYLKYVQSVAKPLFQPADVNPVQGPTGPLARK